MLYTIFILRGVQIHLLRTSWSGWWLHKAPDLHAGVKHICGLGNANDSVKVRI